MAHPLVEQLRFARTEFQRNLIGLSPEDAVVRLMPSNCISWIVGHLAVQEQAYWVWWPTGKIVVPDLFDQCGWGRPASTPPLEAMWSAWEQVTAAADPFLDSLAIETLQQCPERDGQTHSESYGTMLHRHIGHYWYHTGEANALRQQLGHSNLPQFVGDQNKAPYRPEG